MIKDPVGGTPRNLTRLCHDSSGDCYERGEYGMTSLQDILNVFVKYFPWSYENTTKLFKFMNKTRRWVMRKAEEEGRSFHASEFYDQMEEIAKETDYNLNTYTFYGCNGSHGLSFNYTSGYYCGIWTMWHLFTVQR